MIRANVVACYFGRKGSGKSYLARSHLASSPRVIVWDPNGDWLADEPATGWRGARAWSSAAALLREIRARGDYGREVVTDADDTELPKLLRAAFELGDTTLVVEETGTQLETRGAPRALKRILQRGRHRRVNLLICSPRPFGVLRDSTQQADHVYVFATDEPGDLDYWAKRAGKPTAERIRQLPAFHALDLGPAAR